MNINSDYLCIFCCFIDTTDDKTDDGSTDDKTDDGNTDDDTNDNPDDTDDDEADDTKVGSKGDISLNVPQPSLNAI